MYYVDDDKVKKDIAILKKNKKVYQRYLEKIKEIQINPFDPNVTNKKHFGKLSKQKYEKHDIYHISITSSIRIHYIIDNNKIIIENIEYDGLVTLLNALDHDFNSNK